MQTTAEYFCAFCGEPNTTFVDISAGMQQSYVEDCQVCCRPNILFIRVDEHTLDVEIETDCQLPTVKP
ncbi:MAG: CPXCG motif-containing cysteine-rich protein [Prochloraceae cyanobacterium]